MKISIKNKNDWSNQFGPCDECGHNVVVTDVDWQENLIIFHCPQCGGIYSADIFSDNGKHIILQ